MTLNRIAMCAALLSASIAPLGEASATDYGAAVANGIWSNGSTWTPGGGPPGAADDAYIGSNYPAGALATATVSLSGNQSVLNAIVGRGGGDSGTLDLSGFNLSVGNNLTIGQFGGTGTIARTGGGTFSTTNLFIDSANSLTLQSGDTAAAVQINGASQITTAATGNITDNISIFAGGSKLTLGANLSLTQDLDLRGSGATAATVDAAGKDITARDIFIGRFNNSGEIINRGTITATRNLGVDRSNFTFGASDSAVGLFAADGAVVNLHANTALSTIQINSTAQVITAATSNVTTDVFVGDAGSKLTLGADLSLTQDLDIRGTGATAATVDAAGKNISARDIFIGRFNNSGEIINRGTITATRNLTVDRSNFNFGASDSAVGLLAADGAVVNLHANTALSTIQLNTAAQVTTVATSNVTTGVLVQDAGSKLTLGANLSLTQDLDIRGTGATAATVDAAGKNISARDIFIGRFNNSGEIINRGTITATRSLSVDRSNFNFGASDSAVGLFASDGAIVGLHANTALSTIQLNTGAQVSTVATGNVTTDVLVQDAGSKLTLGADLSLTQDLDIRGTGATPATVDAAGKNITARDIYIGRFNNSGEIINRGTITATRSLSVDRSNFNFGASDSAVGLFASDGAVVGLHANTALSTIQLNTGAQVSTVATSNVTSDVLVLDAGSKLTLGANLSLTQDLDIRGTGVTAATVDAAGKNITARDIYIGRFNNSGEIINRGTITATRSLSVDRSNFNFGASDSAVGLFASDGAIVGLHANTALSTMQLNTGAQVTTVATSNVSDSVLVLDAGSKLTLGANLSLTQDLDLRGTQNQVATLDAAGKDITVRDLYIGRFNNAAELINDGAVTVNGSMSVERSTSTLHGGNDQIVGNLQLALASALTIQQAPGGLTGLTLGGTLTLLDTSVLAFQFDGLVTPGLDWVFRWANPNGGDRVAAIAGLISGGAITVTGNPQAYNVFNGGDGYTYIGYNAVPEPSTWLLGCVALAGLVAIRRRRGN